MVFIFDFYLSCSRARGRPGSTPLWAPGAPRGRQASPEALRKIKIPRLTTKRRISLRPAARRPFPRGGSRAGRGATCASGRARPRPPQPGRLRGRPRSGRSRPLPLPRGRGGERQEPPALPAGNAPLGCCGSPPRLGVGQAGGGARGRGGRAAPPPAVTVSRSTSRRPLRSQHGGADGGSARLQRGLLQGIYQRCS